VEEAFLQRVGLVEVARHTDPVEVDPVVHDVPSAPVVVQVEHRIEHVAVRKMEALVEVGRLMEAPCALEVR